MIDETRRCVRKEDGARTPGVNSDNSGRRACVRRPGRFTHEGGWLCAHQRIVLRMTRQHSSSTTRQVGSATERHMAGTRRRMVRIIRDALDDVNGVSGSAAWAEEPAAARHRETLPFAGFEKGRRWFGVQDAGSGASKEDVSTELACTARPDLHQRLTGC